MARGSGGAWVIAVLAALRAAPSVLETDDGSSATLEDGALVVRDGEGRLLFEHRPSEGVSVVHAPHGDLRFTAPRGRIELEAARDVSIESDAGVRLRGREVSLEAPARGDNELRLDRRGAHLSTPELETSAGRARVAIKEATFAAAHLTTAVDKARHVVGVAHTHAERIVSWAKNVYTNVEDLAQTRAGRVREVVSGAHHLSAERSLVRAEQDVSIKAERINLA